MKNPIDLIRDVRLTLIDESIFGWNVMYHATMYLKLGSDYEDWKKKHHRGNSVLELYASLIEDPFMRMVKK